MEEQYARALWTLVAEGTQPKAAVDSIRKLLERQGRASLLPRIARAFARIAAREERKSGITLSVARKKDEREALHDIKSILGELEVDAKDIRTKIDESLIGGWRLEGRGTLVDKSFKTQLLSIYNRATQ